MTPGELRRPPVLGRCGRKHDYPGKLGLLVKGLSGGSWHPRFFCQAMTMVYRSRRKYRSRSPARRHSRRAHGSRRRTSRRTSRRRASRRHSRRRHVKSSPALVAAANHVVANADPVDVERAAGNGTPAQVEQSRMKLANRAKKLIKSPTARGFAGGVGAAGLAGLGYAGYKYATSPGSVFRRKEGEKYGWKQPHKAFSYIPGPSVVKVPTGEKKGDFAAFKTGDYYMKPVPAPRKLLSPKTWFS